MTHASKSLWLSIKLAFLLGMMALLPMSLKAQGYMTGQVISPAGKPAAYATVRVCPYSGGGLPCSPLSSLYSDLALTQPIANPYTTDAFGNFSVAVASSTYIVQTSVTGAVYSYLYTVGAGAAGTGFPITLGSTSIASGSTTTSLAGLTVNGVTLSAAGAATQYLDETGNYSTPAGAGVASLNTLTGALTIACGTGLNCVTGGSTITISLGTAFAITSFTGGWTVPVGAAVVNPSFAATYSVTPASASITNTDSISSPTNLTTPFTSGTITGTFVKTSPATTTFTLSATQGSTLTATQTGNWAWEIFGGYGAAGATSTVNASGTTAVLSNFTVLPRLQIGAETIGEPLGPFTGLTGQNIYLLLTGGSHTFTSAGLPAAFNAPLTVSFVNADGASVTMYLYQSTNALYGNYTIVVAS